MTKQNFASDNYAGAHPKVLEWITKANQGPSPAYGGDDYTARVETIFKSQFGKHTESFLVWNGTAANVLSLQCMAKPHQAILCSQLSHIQEDECAAPEKHIGSKLLSLPIQNGKINPRAIDGFQKRIGDQHAAQPKVISISQATEYGTIYSLKEIKTISKYAHDHGLYLHMDGARISNAAAALKCTFKELTTDVGVDVVSFGGTKNGLLGAEAIVFLNSELAQDFKYTRKQGLHLASKMRFLAAQFLAFFEDDLWKENALQANGMAKLLEKEILNSCPSVKITKPVQANSVFAILSPKQIKSLQKYFYFYVWNETLNEVRLMCSFDTTKEHVQSFVQKLCKS